MQISRVVIRNFRSFEHLDVRILAGTTCVIGENNSGKTNFLHAIRLCIDAGLSSTYRSLAPNDIHSTVDIAHPEQVLIGLEITDFAGKTNEEALVGAWQANEEIAAAETIAEIAKAIDASFKKVTGPAFSMDVALGLAEPSFQAIVRALRILLAPWKVTASFGSAGTCM